MQPRKAPWSVAVARRASWPVAELAYWRSVCRHRRGGASTRGPTRHATPGRLERCGRGVEAVRLPHEAAIALAEGDDRRSGALPRQTEGSWRRPAAKIVALSSRRSGARGVRLGPRKLRRTRDRRAHGSGSRGPRSGVRGAAKRRDRAAPRRLAADRRPSRLQFSRKLGVRSRGEADRCRRSDERRQRWVAQVQRLGTSTADVSCGRRHHAKSNEGGLR